MNTLKRISTSTHVKTFLLILMSLFLTVVPAYSQSNKLETEKGLEEAIAPFDADVRTNILVACEYPQVLMQLRNSQMQTAESFQKMISHFRQKKQEWFYTITRYPDLMHQLATLPAKQSQEDINKLLPHQEPDLQEAAWHLYRSEKKNLVKLDNIQLSANREFDRSIIHLNDRAQTAFHQLQTKPDALALLTNNIDLTARLGNHYKSNPGEITNLLASLHDKWEIQNQRDAAAFKKQIEDDPKAMRELRQASNAYGANQYYSNPYYYPYSYWFGYPYWYPYPMWYPGMYWYYPGFYFGVGGLYGFPSYGFTFWFYNGGYYARYPHLYRQFDVYYRNNITINRTVLPTTTVRSGFMSAAHSYYRPDAHVHGISPYSYNRPANIPHMNNHFNSMNSVRPNTYHTQSWGNFGGRGDFGGRGNFGGGTLGGGFHGGIRGGRH